MSVEEKTITAVSGILCLLCLKDHRQKQNEVLLGTKPYKLLKRIIDFLFTQCSLMRELLDTATTEKWRSLCHTICWLQVGLYDIYRLKG